MSKTMIGNLIVLGSLAIFALGMLAQATYESFKAEQLVWQAENKCIAAFVADGYERRDIKRIKGSCYVIHP